MQLWPLDSYRPTETYDLITIQTHSDLSMAEAEKYDDEEQQDEEQPAEAAGKFDIVG